MHTPAYSGYDEDEAYLLRAIDREKRAAARRWCPECHCTGGHTQGCPETPDDEDDEEQQQ